jgi:multiple sugar transport system substrate-binding protein
MINLTRRSVLRASMGVAAAGAFARPYIANAQAKTAVFWHPQGFVPQEDEALHEFVNDYQKLSGNTIELSIVPFAPLRQKIISAITSGVVPDLISATPAEVMPLQAWDDKLVDVTELVETQKSKMLPLAAASAYCYNNVTKQRSYYGVPYQASVVPFHIWRPLVEKAGYKESDIPDKWDAFIDFFKPVQKKLQEQGMRHTYATAFVVSTIGNDPTNTMEQFVFAYGGKNLVGKDGKFNGKDPEVLEAVIKAVDRLSSLYKDGFIPPSSINWNDADDNNAFHSKLCVMDFDGTLSTELGMLSKQKAEYGDVICRAPPKMNDGSSMPCGLGINSLIVPKGAKNVEVAKDIAKYMIQPEVNGKFLKGGLGRWLPIYPELVKSDPFWIDPKVDPHRPPYVQQAFGGNELIPYYFVYNPGWAQVRSEHPFNVAMHDVTTGKINVKEAVDKAFKRIDEIFATFQIKA